MDDELKQFQEDLLTSVRQMKAGQAACSTHLAPCGDSAYRGTESCADGLKSALTKAQFQESSQSAGTKSLVLDSAAPSKPCT